MCIVREKQKPIIHLANMLVRSKKNGKLVIATGNYYPFEFHDPKTYELVGYDIEVGKKIAEKIGVPVEWKEMQFTALIPTLQNKQADLVIATMYITDERKKVVDISDITWIRECHW